MIIIDEAEKLFLATLERFVRHLGEGIQDFSLTILLSGRPGLDANLDQLAAFCAQVDAIPGYSLEPLTENETRQYLRFRLYAAGLSREQHEDIFTEGAVAKIFDTAQGNLRMINILAEESLQVSYSEKSFMVLLDHVDPESTSLDGVESRVIEIYDLLRQNKLVTGLLTAAVIVVLALGFLLTGQGSKQSQPVASSQKPKEAIKPHIPAPPPAQSVPDVTTTVTAPTAQPTPPEATPPIKEAPATLPSSVPQPVQQLSLPSAPQTVTANAESNASATPVPSNVSGATANSVPAKHEQTSPAQGQQKATAALSKDEEIRDGEKTFRDRRGASASWLAGAYRNGYTIQLMMLASEQAEASLAKMLIQDDYFPFREQFFILRKKGPPQTFFIFYGIFSSLDAARDARNSMPVFLRKHHPYPLAIGEALKKTEN